MLYKHTINYAFFSLSDKNEKQKGANLLDTEKENCKYAIT